jgi:hypothetical protein
MKWMTVLFGIMLLPPLWAAGLIWVSNRTGTSSMPVNAPVYDDNGVALTGDRYVVQLYGSRTLDSIMSVGPIGKFQSPFGPGYFKGFEVALPFAEPGDDVWVQLRVWSLEDGETFEEAALLGKWTGVSNFLPIRAGGAGGGVPDLAANMYGLSYPGLPLIIRQPDDSIVRTGSHATFSVTASTSFGGTYQWFNADTGAQIAGATNAVFSTGPLIGTERYQVRVGNVIGSEASRVATARVVQSLDTYLDIALETNRAVLLIHGVPSTTYRIEVSEDVTASSWTLLKEVMVGEGAQRVEDPLDRLGQRYYRLTRMTGFTSK